METLKYIKEENLLCNVKGCSELGSHPAPQLYNNKWQWMCLEHVKEFNRKWKHNSGSQEMNERATWGRRTWPLKNLVQLKKRKEIPTYILNSFKVMQMQPTTIIEEVKRKYKVLALKYHPDKKGDNDSIEKLKEINKAYKIIIDYLHKQD